ncbi:MULTISPECIES: MBL fold metallo-hydrolase [Fervidicoccus]|uniref:MBL fold metallo-hydrolase n=1 Tax=Fervidicoccus fontis TaxID=683846 RepID=A0A2J6N4K6_9CREN|nr:MBL fold metallo-hydrolase [Fervidicoccus fontis]PMB75377.1 MAG: MBL fold metallo-hydrolase [Fervidicoccus fontis]PMB76269.1 MAG: MBL fold metallo-hydrolase [Fervidicoccus fontis]HEW64242.1 MBL fold metallo-hydrolase [Fervidicoccus fontis]
MEVFLIKGMCNTYLTSEGILIDAGAKPSDVLSIAKEHGISIKYVLITHYHYDHIKYASEIAERTKAKVVAPEAEADIIEGSARPKFPSLSLRIMSLFATIKPVKVDIKVKDGDEVAGMKAVAAPGHTPGSTAYVSGDIMFSGDAIESDNGKPSFPPRKFTLDQIMAEKSMKKLLELRPKIIYPGHGRPITMQ